MSTSKSKSFSCLYTKHKTQKRKTWNDGKLTIEPSGLVHLFPVSHDGSNIIQSGANCTLDALVLTLDEAKRLLSGVVTDLEMEKFLIEIESEWKRPATSLPTPDVDSNAKNNSNVNVNTTQQNSNHRKASTLLGKKRTNGMQKLLTNKFRKPTKYIPKPKQPNNANHLMRKRPLQPGEYMRQFDGNAGGNFNGANESTYNQSGNWSAHNRQHVNAAGHNSTNANNTSSHRHPIISNNVQNQTNGRFLHHTPHPSTGTTIPVRPQQEYHQPQNQNEHQHPHYDLKSQSPRNPHAPPSTGRAMVRPNNPYKSSQSQPGSHTKIQSQPKHQFISNDFDPNSFYEEEEEEEEDNAFDVHGGEPNESQSRGAALELSKGKHSDAHSLDWNAGGTLEPRTETGWRRMEERRGEDTQPTEQPLHSSQMESGSNSNVTTMTNSDLLQLFCGGTDDACKKSDEENRVHNHNPNGDHENTLQTNSDTQIYDNRKDQADPKLLSGEQSTNDTSDDESEDGDNLVEDKEDESITDAIENNRVEGDVVGNSFLQGLLRSDLELEQNAKVEFNAIGEVNDDFGDEHPIDANHDGNSDSDSVFNDTLLGGDSSILDKGHANPKGKDQRDCETESTSTDDDDDGEPMSFDINIPDEDSEESFTE